jgi:hypothetical protein
MMSHNMRRGAMLLEVAREYKRKHVRCNIQFDYSIFLAGDRITEY